MRRMRDLTFGHYVAAAVPVLAASYGIHYMIQHHTSTSGKQPVAAVIKPSQFKEDDTKASRKLASAERAARRKAMEDSLKNPELRESQPTQHDTPVETSAGVKSGSERKPSVALEGAANDAVSTGAECASIEYRGDGPESTKVTKGEWTAVMDLFHAAKHNLLGWLEKRRHELPEGTVQAMEHQIRNLKIQRPPASEEPDLAWRGIGVYGQNSEGEPIVKLGGGFVKLAVKHPARARFEMARLVAQSWSPCEMQRIGATDTTWSPLLKCLGVTENPGCGIGTYSEGGWAVSTTLAAIASPPGCQIPAFATTDGAKCAGHIPLGQLTAQNDAPAEPARSVASSSASTSTHPESKDAKGGRQ